MDMWLTDLGRGKSLLREACNQRIWRLVADNRLGAGASGVVHVACRGSNCKYIVKVMRGEAHLRELFIAQIASEGGIGPAVYDAWICTPDTEQPALSWFPKSGPIFCMIQQRVEAPTLAKWLTSVCDDRKQAFAYMMNLVLEAVKRMHQLGIHHGDLTEDNVMVVANQDILILDYGDAVYGLPVPDELRLRDVQRALAMFYVESAQVIREWGVDKRTGRFTGKPAPNHFVHTWTKCGKKDALEKPAQTAARFGDVRIHVVHSTAPHHDWIESATYVPQEFVCLQTRPGHLPTSVQGAIATFSSTCACPVFVV